MLFGNGCLGAATVAVRQLYPRWEGARHPETRRQQGPDFILTQIVSHRVPIVENVGVNFIEMGRYNAAK